MPRHIVAPIRVAGANSSGPILDNPVSVAAAYRIPPAPRADLWFMTHHHLGKSHAIAEKSNYFGLFSTI